MMQIMRTIGPMALVLFILAVPAPAFMVEPPLRMLNGVLSIEDPTTICAPVGDKSVVININAHDLTPHATDSWWGFWPWNWHGWQWLFGLGLLAILFAARPFRPAAYILPLLLWVSLAASGCGSCDGARYGYDDETTCCESNSEGGYNCS